MGFKLTPADELSFGNVDDGTYQADFTGYSAPRASNFDSSKQFTNLKFTIREDDDFDGQEVDGTVTIDSPKWEQWIGAIEGGTYTGDGELEDLFGKRVVITVQNATKKDSVYSNVVGVAVSRRKKSAPKPAPKPSKPAKDDFEDEGDGWDEEE